MHGICLWLLDLWNMSVAASSLYLLASVFSGCLSQRSWCFVNECDALKNGAVHHIFDVNTYPLVVAVFLLLCCSPQDPTPA